MYSFKDISLGQILVTEGAKDRTSPFPSGNTSSNGQGSTTAMLVDLQIHFVVGGGTTQLKRKTYGILIQNGMIPLPVAVANEALSLGNSY